MAIAIMFYPWDSEKNDWSDEGILFNFGQMTTEYYNKVALDNYDNATDYGLFVDNVISRGSNIYTTLAPNGMTLGEIGIKASDFTNNSQTHYDTVTKYKINDDLYCNFETSISIYGYSDGSEIGFSWRLLFKSPRLAYDYSITPTQGSFQGYFGNGRFKSYSDFYNLCGGMHPISKYTNAGFVFGMNSFPYSSDLVEESKTTTGCCIQSYTLYPKGTEIGIYAFHTGINGITGSEIPYIWSSASATDRTYVPLILGAGFEAVFPESESAIVPGDYDNGSDEGDPQRPPEQSAVSSGMVRLYQMTTSQLTEFAKFLWNTDLTEWDTFVNTLKQWFSNPLDSIIALTISPVDYFYDYFNGVQLPNTSVNIKIGSFDTGVQGSLCSNNYKQISLGKISMKPYFNSFLDCNPHTTVSIYLPYIGFQELDANVLYSIAGCDIEVIYNVDIMTGVCVANIVVEKVSEGTNLRHVLYTFSGNVNTTIPISSANMKDFITACVTATASTVGMIATGGASSGLALAGSVAGAVGNVAKSSKMNIGHGSSTSLEGGMFAMQYAYLVVKRPREARPSNYKEINGIPTEMGGTLGSFSGFTQVSSVHVSIDGATDEEKKEIEQLLKAGVIL